MGVFKGEERTIAALEQIAKELKRFNDREAKKEQAENEEVSEIVRRFMQQEPVSEEVAPLYCADCRESGSAMRSRTCDTSGCFNRRLAR